MKINFRKFLLLSLHHYINNRRRMLSFWATQCLHYKDYSFDYFLFHLESTSCLKEIALMYKFLITPSVP